MKKKNYVFEAEYIQVMVNWRRACDERGLSQLQRCRHNHQLLQYLLDDLMPWHRQEYDLSTLEVNRYVCVHMQGSFIISIDLFNGLV